MISHLNSIELHGLEAFLINIEVDRRAGRPAFIIVGLPDTAVQEARERVTSAIKNSGFKFPRAKVIVNLAPADVKKVGPRYDLAIALGILIMSKQLKSEGLRSTITIGELALNGQMRGVNGILNSVEYALKKGFKRIIVPKENAAEAHMIPGIEVIAAGHLKEVILHLKKKVCAVPFTKKRKSEAVPKGIDMKEIKGQIQAKRALEIAAAGGHNVLLCGTPGAGKTLMAKALNGILPAMHLKEMLEVSKIYSIAGLLPKDKPLVTTRPFRTIHHTASGVSIVGGGNQPHPGEISLAHRGVLFMDEIAEFPRPVLEVLRQPLEDRKVTVSRVRGTFVYPCQFTLIAAMNPCPCGYQNAENTRQECTCTAIEIKRYKKKLSGPLMDRIDLFVHINPVSHDELTNLPSGESTEVIRQRVEKANQIQKKRFQEMSIEFNAEMNNRDIRQHCLISSEAEELLRRAMNQFNLSARGYFKILKLSRTIADLAEVDRIDQVHIAEALQFRNKAEL